MTFHNGNEEGFTLVEVLVAFVILAGAIILSFQVFADGLRRLTSAEARIKAVGVARSELARLAISANMPEGIQTGTTDGVAWKMTVITLDGFAAGGFSTVQPFRVEVRLTGERNTPAETPVIETILLGRAVSP